MLVFFDNRVVALGVLLYALMDKDFHFLSKVNLHRCFIRVDGDNFLCYGGRMCCKDRLDLLP